MTGTVVAIDPSGHEADSAIAAASEISFENTLKVETTGSNPVGTTTSDLPKPRLWVFGQR